MHQIRLFTKQLGVAVIIAAFRLVTNAENVSSITCGKLALGNI